MTAPVQTPARSATVVPLRYLAGALVVLAALSLVPLWAPLVLAAWTAELLESLAARFARRLGGRSRAAAVLTALVVVVFLLPVVVTSVSLVAATADVLTELKKSRQASDVLRAFLPADLAPSLSHFDLQRVADFARRHGLEAMGTFQVALGALTTFAVGAVVYVFGVYECIANGSRVVTWLRERSLVPRAAFRRLSAAFVETGRGLFFGIGVTALFQAVIATVGFVAVGVPQPLLLGFITLLASLVPSFGTALVWVPVSVTLLVFDRTIAGVVMIGIGCVTSIVDNFVRPWLSRYGHLRLPTFVTFVAMLGGIVVFGGFGLLLGPLFVRLAVEALDIWRDRRKVEAS